MERPAFKTITLIIIGIVMVLAACGCGDRQSNKMAKKNTIDDSAATTPERTYVEISNSAIFEDDFKTSIKNGDLRFVGILRFTLYVPEVPDYDVKYSKSNGVKIIEGTSDSFEDITAMRQAEFFEIYAKGYNTLLLSHLAGTDSL